MGWLLDPEDRARLLARFPPAYPNVVAHHVTLGLGSEASLKLPHETAGVVVGIGEEDVGGGTAAA